MNPRDMNVVVKEPRRQAVAFKNLSGTSKSTRQTAKLPRAEKYQRWKSMAFCEPLSSGPSAAEVAL